MTKIIQLLSDGMKNYIIISVGGELSPKRLCNTHTNNKTYLFYRIVLISLHHAYSSPNKLFSPRSLNEVENEYSLLQYVFICQYFGLVAISDQFWDSKLWSIPNLLSIIIIIISVISYLINTIQVFESSWSYQILKRLKDWFPLLIVNFRILKVGISLIAVKYVK